MLIEMTETRWQELKLKAMAERPATSTVRGVLIDFPAPASQPFILTAIQR